MKLRSVPISVWRCHLVSESWQVCLTKRYIRQPFPREKLSGINSMICVPFLKLTSVATSLEKCHLAPESWSLCHNETRNSTAFSKGKVIGINPTVCLPLLELKSVAISLERCHLLCLNSNFFARNTFLYYAILGNVACGENRDKTPLLVIDLVVISSHIVNVPGI